MKLLHLWCRGGCPKEAAAGVEQVRGCAAQYSSCSCCLSVKCMTSIICTAGTCSLEVLLHFWPAPPNDDIRVADELLLLLLWPTHSLSGQGFSHGSFVTTVVVCRGRIFPHISQQSKLR